ncbi:hypothetical protein AA0229_1786 [Gluconobacter cerinus NRIC 0229]|nr:hypothetical protein AA0229_1786 [Gluconobacter cerinus NRIC 0229]
MKIQQASFYNSHHRDVENQNDKAHWQHAISEGTPQQGRDGKGNSTGASGKGRKNN